MAPTNPKDYIAPDMYVKVFDIHGQEIGTAKTDHWLRKEGVVLLDRRVGLYATYPLTQLQFCEPEEVPALVQKDEKLEHGDVLHHITKSLYE